MRIRHTFLPTSFLVSLVAVLALMPATSFGQRGIAPEGREFFVGYMPPAQERVATPYYALVGSAVDQRVTVNYFDENGQETQGQSVAIAPLTVAKIPLDRLHMRPEKPGEILEYKAAVIRSKYPVSVQIYNEGTLSGGMLLAIPTPALGKHYVVSAWNDNPTIPAGLQSGWNGHNLRDSTCSEFMIIGAYNGTTVQIVTNSTTFGGQIGVNGGYKSDGTPHPKQITINKGQVYWVRSNPGDAAWDLSNSVIKSDKPIAVIAGHEKALLGDPSGIWRFLDNDFRDMMLEQMIPVESWANDGYVSIPFEPPLRRDTRMLKNGEGDLYRMYTSKPTGGAAELYQGGRVDAYEYLLSEYQLPVAQRENVIEDAVNIFERDAAKMNVVMYDYFQGIHDVDPGEEAGEKGRKPTESTNYTTPNEMNIIPMRNWRRTALFKVPANSLYNGAQFINLITYRDSLPKIFMKINGKDPKQMSSIPTRRVFNIPQHPDLVGIRYKLAPADYYIYGNTPFACYSYGRTDGWYKDDFGYAAPVAGAFGNFEEALAPEIEIKPNCSSWDVKIKDSRPNDQGLADAFMLVDPNAQFWQPARVSVNMRMSPDPLVLKPTDTVANIQIIVEDPFLDAVGYLYVVDRAGNDTVYTFTYKAPSFTKSLTAMAFGALDVGTEKCSTIVFTNTAKPGGIPVRIESIDLLLKTQGFRINSISRPLPATLNGGESISVNVCYKADDALIDHLDSLLLKTDCFLAGIPLTGSGKAPAIYASDFDFQKVSVGGSLCTDITVENVGTAAFTLTKQWLMDNAKDFTFPDSNRLPIVIQPGTSVKLRFCYEPKEISAGDSARIDWGTDMPAQFKGQKKDYTLLWGYAVAPEVVWVEDITFFDTECDSAVTKRLLFTNHLNSEESLSAFEIFGPDANEFKIVGMEFPAGSLPPSRGVGAGDTMWVDIQFTPDLSKGYASRLAYIRTDALLGKDDTTVLSAHIVYADLKSNVTSVDFGTAVGGNQLKKTVRYTNPGTADLVVKTVSVSDPAFRVLSGIAVGDTIYKDGGFTDVELEGTAPNVGVTTGELLINGITACPPTVRTPLSINGFQPSAQSTGFDAPMTFVCRINAQEVTFRNTGGTDIMLEKVEIVDGSTGTYSQHFHFADGSRAMTLNRNVASGTTEAIPVIFEPTSVIPAGSSAIARFTWSHTFDGKTVTSVLESPITGLSQVLDNVFSVAKDDGSIYSADPMERFSIDVKMLKDIIPAGDIKRAKFGIEFRQDLFRFETFDAGMDLAATHSDPQVTGDLVNTVWIDVNGDLLNQDVLGTLQFTLLVSRDLESPFKIIDPVMYSSDNQEACYMTVTEIPANFKPREWCGTQVLRDALNGILPTVIVQMTPNPAKDVISLTYDVNVADVPVTIEMYDLLGNKVSSVMTNKSHDTGRYTESIDASQLATGNYTIRIVGGDRVTTRQIMVKH